MSDPRDIPTRPFSQVDAHPAAPAGLPSRRSGVSRAALLWIAAAVVFVLLATGAVAFGYANGRQQHSPAPLPTGAAAAKRDQPGDPVSPQPIKTCSISALAASKNLGTFYASVYDATAKAVSWSKNADGAQRPGSIQKVITAAAAIAVLGPDYRITTQVQDGVTPGSIVLVGAGDVTLSRLPAGQQSVYAGAAHMSDLATKAIAAYTSAHPGVPLTQVILDSSYWDPTDNWNSTWPRSAQAGGSMSLITALQVDGDRADPTVQNSPRSSDPVSRAGNAFVAALAMPGVTTTTGTAENGAPVLASVASQPLSTLVKQMLLQNDNTLAEALARIVSVKEDKSGTTASLQDAITTALASYGIDTAGMTVDDGSGLSTNDAVTANYVTELMTLVGAQTSDLNYVYAGLPIAGKSGRLLTRFTGPNAAVVGKLHGTAGGSPTASTLTGYLKAKDGTLVAFTFYAMGSAVTASTATTVDSLAAALYGCGANLTTK
ncbi:D-alanyl-D-alanine carboxypeptidase/D-alanyl-D-alanine endopeptidase [Galbitalea soli]|uniref:D-alanyl-D-alanine carboxypeptidase/D-alanyl-D-alanine-endopeptidase n=1 Tax=Galbitalea soli TaxID=1268042 RepID=A0A7C9PMW9_9MICO|nr:D-alanyl-D-alanine carboxypeptidase/D-alanyl-D-alanine-endopeptidase [Galbitalea soli]NYJ29963.1 D-alanyl-D-alanine carboxypeptidase/D-alanyl-D-alanine-endopeptidase (penicillin-binding protein 4) [Galbitalea soli]